jgi:Putative prokaryotic signal transducing protein
MPEELETVATFHDLTQAQAARAALEGEGVSSQLLDEMTGSIDWGLMPAMGGLRLQVPKAQALRARTILNDIVSLVPDELEDPDGGDSVEEGRYRAAATERKRQVGRVALLLLFLPALIGLIVLVVSWLAD